MIPMPLTNATRTLAKDQPEFIELDIFDEILNGVPHMSSLWIPSPEELEVLNAGGGVHLCILGTQHPPVYLSAQPAAEDIEINT